MNAPSEVTQIVSYVDRRVATGAQAGGLRRSCLTGMCNGDHVLAGEEGFVEMMVTANVSIFKPCKNHLLMCHFLSMMAVTPALVAILRPCLKQ